MRIMRIDNLITQLSKDLPKSYTESNFYSYVENAFKTVSVLAEMDDADVKMLNKETKDNVFKTYCSKLRIINLIRAIQKTCLNILEYAYKGDLQSASMLLGRLLYIPKYTQYKLMDVYGNYFQMQYDRPNHFYRCRDEEKQPDDCWHVPFELRHKASCSRFNMSGYPCMYLSDSEVCASQELGKLEKGKKRWAQSFTPTKPLFFLNLSMPKEQEIKEMRTYDKLCFLLTYPIAILCLARTKTKGWFHEEYLFSQLFLQTLFLHDKHFDNGFQGICYSSTKCLDGKNYVIPATDYNAKILLEGHSKAILDILATIDIPYQIET